MADTMMPLEVYEVLGGEAPPDTRHGAEMLDLVKSGTPPEAAAMELGLSPDEGGAVWSRLEEAARARRGQG
jgi:hypothetical protein